MNKEKRQKLLKILFVVSILYLLGMFALVLILPQPDRSTYRRYFDSSYLCQVPEGAVCYEDWSVPSKYIHFLDEGADGTLDGVVVHGSGNTQYVTTQVVYKLHRDDCSDLLGINSGTRGGPVTICLADGDPRVEELQRMYDLVRQRFNEEHPSIQDLPENNREKLEN